MAWLAGRSEVGDGELGCVLRDLQRQHFQPTPDAETRVREPQHEPSLGLKGLMALTPRVALA